MNVLKCTTTSNTAWIFFICAFLFDTPIYAYIPSTSFLFFFWIRNSLRIFAISFSYLIYHFCWILWMNIHTLSLDFSRFFRRYNFFPVLWFFFVHWNYIFHTCAFLYHIFHITYLVAVAVVFFSVLFFFVNAYILLLHLPLSHMWNAFIYKYPSNIHSIR